MSATIDPASMSVRLAHQMCTNPAWMVEEFNGDFNVINWTASEENLRKLIYAQLSNPTALQLKWPEIDR